jgi:hypothetical protein
MQNHPSTVVCTDEGIFIWPGVSIASRGTRRSDQEICNLLACFHGPGVVHTAIVPAIGRAANLVESGHLEMARRNIDQLHPIPLSPSGKSLMWKISSRLGVNAPNLQVADGMGTGQFSPALAQRIAPGFDSVRERARELEKNFCAKVLDSLAHDAWDETKHPRVGGGANPGWFAPVGNGSSSVFSQEEHDSRNAQTGPTPIADFSGGFHDAVVDDLLKAFAAAGVPAVKEPAIRLIGPNTDVVGYPDILIHAPGQPVEAIDVKTGNLPTLTPNQAFYIPMLQIGGHIYSTDPRMVQLGLTPGEPFPPMPFWIIYVRGPGQPYTVNRLPPPVITKTLRSAIARFYKRSVQP